MDELIAFLRAQLDEDEQVARIVSDGGYDPQTWRSGPGSSGDVGVLLYGDDHMIGDPDDLIEEAEGPFAVIFGGRAENGHITRWDPARVVAEVEAKRRLLRQFELRRGAVLGLDGVETGGVWDDLLRLLAQPYAGRDGWREEWRA